MKTNYASSLLGAQIHSSSEAMGCLAQNLLNSDKKVTI